MVSRCVVQIRRGHSDMPGEPCRHRTVRPRHPFPSGDREPVVSGVGHDFPGRNVLARIRAAPRNFAVVGYMAMPPPAGVGRESIRVTSKRSTGTIASRSESPGFGIHALSPHPTAQTAIEPNGSVHYMPFREVDAGRRLANPVRSGRKQP